MRKILAALISLFLFVASSAVFAASISDAKTGKGIVDREITEEVGTFVLNETAYLWMRVAGGSGETITVTWANGDQYFDVALSIGSDSWRTWSSKILHLTGLWTITVTDSAGTSLYQTTVTVQ
ncbi:MAG: DUF2914 domain-containing protein [Burkholderiales bacterium]|nr:DUF2914 domain-containing protein [Burkholderiales bacterium]